MYSGPCRRNLRGATRVPEKRANLITRDFIERIQISFRSVPEGDNGRGASRFGQYAYFLAFLITTNENLWRIFENIRRSLRFASSYFE